MDEVRKELLDKIFKRFTSSMEFLKGQYNYLSGLDIDVNISAYADNNGRYGSYIDRLYEDYVIIVCPMCPAYSLLNTPTKEYQVYLSKLTTDDLKKIVECLYKD